MGIYRRKNVRLATGARESQVKGEKQQQRPQKIVNRNQNRPPQRQRNQRQFYGTLKNKRSK